MNDKLKHIIVLFVIAVVLVIAIRFLWTRDMMILAWPASILIAAGKEVIWDGLFKKGTPEFKDFWAGVWSSGLATSLGYVIL